MTTPAPPATVAELREAQQREYGQYVATVPIDIDGGRAFNPGDPVPASHVKSGVVTSDQVAKTGTKAASSVTTTEGTV